MSIQMSIGKRKPGVVGLVIQFAQKPSILLTVYAVMAASILSGVLAEVNGLQLNIGFSGAQNTRNHATIHNPVVSVWHAILLMFLPWLLLTFLSAIRREKRSGFHADIESEGGLLALPYYLLTLLIAGFLAMRAMNIETKTLATNIAAILTCSLLLLILRILIKQVPAKYRLCDMTSRLVADKRSRLMTMAANAGIGTFLLVTAAIVVGGINFGYLARYSFLTADPLNRGINTVLLVGSLWFLVSWVLGNYRTRVINDPLGMKVSLLATSRPILLFFVTVGVFGLAANALQYRGVISSSDKFIIVAVLLSTIICAIDIFYVMNSLVTLSRDYTGIAGLLEELYGPKADKSILVVIGPSKREFSIRTGFDRFLNSVGRIEPAFEAWASTFLRILQLKPPTVSKDTVSCAEIEASSKWIGAISTLSVVAIAQGVALSQTGRPILGHFIGLRSPTADALIGAGLAAVSLFIISIPAIIVQRLLGAKGYAATTLSVIGLALLPACAAAIFTGILPEHVRYPVAGTLYPAMLVLGAAYVALAIATSFPSNRNSVAVGAAVTILLVVLIGYTGSCRATSAIHTLLLRRIHVPVVQVRDRLSDGVPDEYTDDIRLVLGQLRNVDTADINTCDLIDHVVYSRKVANRYYGHDGNPESIPTIRIRSEVTTNSGWMRYLYPKMQQVTRQARTPDEAVRVVYSWIKSLGIHVEPTTFPFGDKFGLDPITTLRGKRGDHVDIAVLMVAALRSAGVAAHIVPVYPDRFAHNNYALTEYYDGYNWKPCYPALERKPEPHADPRTLSAISNWFTNGKGENEALYVLQGGVWRPYCPGGRDVRAEVIFSLYPGTYLATYTVGDMCYVRNFILRPRK